MKNILWVGLGMDDHDANWVLEKLYQGLSPQKKVKELVE